MVFVVRDSTSIKKRRERKKNMMCSFVVMLAVMAFARAEVATIGTDDGGNLILDGADGDVLVRSCSADGSCASSSIVSGILS